jgi:peroxiredoxin
VQSHAHDTTRHLLDNGDALPDLRLPSVSGSTVSLHDAVAGAWSVILFYRGNWCPFCNAQLAAFGRRLAQFEQLGVHIIAISADDVDEARQTVEKNHIAFPVLYGADPHAAAATFGTHVATDEHGTYINSSGFIVDPDGSIVLAVYSSGAIGRIVAEDALGMIKYLQATD